MLAGSVPHPYGSFPCLLRKKCEKNNIHKLPSFSNVSLSKWEVVHTNSVSFTSSSCNTQHSCVVSPLEGHWPG